MEVIGNINRIKTSILDEFDSQIKIVESEKNQKISEIKEAEELEIAGLKKSLESRKDAQVEKAYLSVYNEEQLKLKKQFEERRQEILDAVFEEAKKKSQKFATSKDYISFVKKSLKQIPKKAKLYGHSTAYSKHFKGIKTDKKIIGIRAEEGDITYDLTLPSLIESQKEQLKGVILEDLFGKTLD